MANIDAYIKRIRFLTKDFKKKNLLIVDENGDQDYENTDEEIKMAIDYIFDTCETTPPLVVKQALDKWYRYDFFTIGVIACLLDSNALLGIRNTMPISDGGQEINDTFKAGPYSTQAANMKIEFREKLKEYKIHYNLSNFAWCGTSDYYDDFFSIYGYRY